MLCRPGGAVLGLTAVLPHRPARFEVRQPRTRLAPRRGVPFTRWQCGAAAGRGRSSSSTGDQTVSGEPHGSPARHVWWHCWRCWPMSPSCCCCRSRFGEQPGRQGAYMEVMADAVSSVGVDRRHRDGDDAPTCRHRGGGAGGAVGAAPGHHAGPAPSAHLSESSRSTSTSTNCAQRWRPSTASPKSTTCTSGPSRCRQDAATAPGDQRASDPVLEDAQRDPRRAQPQAPDSSGGTAGIGRGLPLRRTSKPSRVPGGRRIAVVEQIPGSAPNFVGLTDGVGSREWHGDA